MARVSTHVLDTSRGVPAAGVAIELYGLEGGDRRLLATAVTNADGRTGDALFSAARLEPGTYELVFRVGPYFAPSIPPADPPFLGDVIVRIGLADPDGSYHIPLLVSPYGYSTYRGS